MNSRTSWGRWWQICGRSASCTKESPMGGGDDKTTQTSTATSTPSAGPGQGPLLALGASTGGMGRDLLSAAGPQLVSIAQGGTNAPFLGPAYSGIDEGAARQIRWIDQNIPPGGQRDAMKNDVMTQAGAQRINTQNVFRMQGLKGATSLGEYLTNAALGAYQPLAWAGGTTQGTVNVTQPGGS